MTKFLAIIGFVVVALSGCATDATVRASPSDFPGTYYSGSGPGRIVTVTLQPDGTFSSDWEGCLGVYGQAKGTWRLDQDQLYFETLSATGELAGYLKQATTIRHYGQLGFARRQDVKNDKVKAELVFLKAPRK